VAQIEEVWDHLMKRPIQLHRSDDPPFGRLIEEVERKADDGEKPHQSCAAS
jgi:hypothetical protein